MRITYGSGKRRKGKVYIPPALGNGDLSFQIDYEGRMKQDPYTSGLGMAMYPGIRRAGFRYDCGAHNLIPFGWFDQRIRGSGELKEWTQTLDTIRGCVECICLYENDLRVRTEIFCHLTRNIIAIRKTFSRRVEYSFRHVFGRPFRMTLRREGKRLFYNVDEGQYEGVIGFWSDSLRGDGGETLGGNVRGCTIFLAFGEENILRAETEGFDNLLAEHCAQWASYWSEGGIHVPDAEVQRAYETAQYHLRISSTRWSIPTGIFDAHWHGRYFAFDEYFAFRGLLSSGHLSIARKVPEFRYSLLDKAIARASVYSEEVNTGAARYAWETLEDGGEGAPPGIWIDHLFHMAHIALACRDYVLFSGDRKFLKEKGYPVLRGCARFYSLMTLERRPDGSVVLGHCTDLERLGAGRVNAFMSSCGVIATLEAAAEAAVDLRTDVQEAESWRKDAAALRKSLPHDAEKYLPYPDCPQKSIAVFSGTYPYPVLSQKDPYQKNAMADYEENGGAFGNMYPHGKGLCAWYAGWIAVVHARFGKGNEAWKQIREIARQTGCFSEIFEIHELAHHPWFTTAEGIFVQAVNELFLQVHSDGSHSECPALPETWKNYSFSLPAADGRRIHVRCRNGKISRSESLFPQAEEVR